EPMNETAVKFAFERNGPMSPVSKSLLRRFSTPSQSIVPRFGSASACCATFCVSPRKHTQKNAVLPEGASRAISELTLVISLERSVGLFGYLTSETVFLKPLLKALYMPLLKGLST